MQSTVVELESVHTIVDDSLLRHTPSSRHDGNDGGGAVDVENAVLLQELMALKVGAADIEFVKAGLSGGLLEKECIVADDVTLDVLSLDVMSRCDSVRSDA